MQNFLSDLLHACTADCKPPENDPEREAAVRDLFALEETLTQQFGIGFADRYSIASAGVHAWEKEAAFLQGIRLGFWLSGAVSGQSSST